MCWVIWDWERVKFVTIVKRGSGYTLVKKADWVNLTVCPKGSVHGGDSVCDFEVSSLQVDYILQNRVEFTDFSQMWIM